MDVLERIDGVVIGLLVGFDGRSPLVVFVGNPSETAVPARCLCQLEANAVGCEVALLFEGGDPARPLIIGRIVEPRPSEKPAEVVRDGESLVINARQRIELRCGQASIILEKDGKITIRGTQLTSQASGVNIIRGGAVHLN
ncbi:DUF6484 domain-containing protein [Mesorhizobium sp. BR1-1-16]|uniref:DUF6484 domain-containing protein n=1 Tax=Mesorhizobium sp. BR1-1-16 TaxID=2876653 RepID=UPI001CC9A97B|nr:DUF6484 domain-containing protein [Mesorhizobium sp. BR1-1-16]MBZ9936331.1 DUF6484 domain-containing protein [Mesorhizobium sp. BR1-1-16]